MKKGWILSLVLVVVLAVAGLSFAAWTEAINIHGTVNTGDINPLFTRTFTLDDGVVNDPEIDPEDDGTDPLYDRDVASTAATISPDGKTITCVIENGYPCYFTETYFEITNQGSVPVKITGLDVDSPPEVTVEPWVEDEEIDPGETVAGYLINHVAEESMEGLDAGETATYQFTATINCEQWNTED